MLKVFCLIALSVVCASKSSENLVRNMSRSSNFRQKAKSLELGKNLTKNDENLRKSSEFLLSSTIDTLSTSCSAFSLSQSDQTFCYVSMCGGISYTVSACATCTGSLFSGLYDYDTFDQEGDFESTTCGSGCSSTFTFTSSLSEGTCHTMLILTECSSSQCTGNFEVFSSIMPTATPSISPSITPTVSYSPTMASTPSIIVGGSSSFFIPTSPYTVSGLVIYSLDEISIVSGYFSGGSAGGSFFASNPCLCTSCTTTTTQRTYLMMQGGTGAGYTKIVALSFTVSSGTLAVSATLAKYTNGDSDSASCTTLQNVYTSGTYMDIATCDSCYDYGIKNLVLGGAAVTPTILPSASPSSSALPSVSYTPSMASTPSIIVGGSSSFFIPTSPYTVSGLVIDSLDEISIVSGLFAGTSAGSGSLSSNPCICSSCVTTTTQRTFLMMHSYSDYTKIVALSFTVSSGTLAVSATLAQYTAGDSDAASCTTLQNVYLWGNYMDIATCDSCHGYGIKNLVLAGAAVTPTVQPTSASPTVSFSPSVSYTPSMAPTASFLVGGSGFFIPTSPYTVSGLVIDSLDEISIVSGFFAGTSTGGGFFLTNPCLCTSCTTTTTQRTYLMMQGGTGSVYTKIVALSFSVSSGALAISATLAQYTFGDSDSASCTTLQNVYTSGNYMDIATCDSCHGYGIKDLVLTGAAVTPTVRPTAPTVTPTAQPTAPTVAPSVLPSTAPTLLPSARPSEVPSIQPSATPSFIPTTVQPTLLPTLTPTLLPTLPPTLLPTMLPTMAPSVLPSTTPSNNPTVTPSIEPTLTPTYVPSLIPSNLPSVSPTLVATLSPISPSVSPSALPSVIPTAGPTSSLLYYPGAAFALNSGSSVITNFKLCGGASYVISACDDCVGTLSQGLFDETVGGQVSGANIVTTCDESCTDMYTLVPSFAEGFCHDFQLVTTCQSTTCSGRYSITPSNALPSAEPTSSPVASATNDSMIVVVAVVVPVAALLCFALGCAFYLRHKKKDKIGPIMVEAVSIHSHDVESGNAPMASKSGKDSALTIPGSSTRSFGSFRSISVSPKPSTDHSDPPERTDMFLTHDWGVDQKNHATVSLINEELKRIGVKTWFDGDKMEGNVKFKMMEGIKNTKCVVVFITQRYVGKVDSNNQGDNCHYEFQYAVRRHPNNFIPVVVETVMLDKEMWGTGLFESTLGGLKPIDFTGDVKNPVVVADVSKQIQERFLAMLKRDQEKLEKEKADKQKAEESRRGALVEAQIVR